MEKVEVIGIVCSDPMDSILDRLTARGGEAVLVEPLYVYGRLHCLSAVAHARRSFSEGTNRARDLPAEVMMYLSGERQASRAISRMRPRGNRMVAILIDAGPDLTGIIRDDSLIDGTPDKAVALGLDPKGTSVTCEQLALELVAMLDVEKY